MQSFHLESITAGVDCAVLRVGGEVDVATAPEIRGRVIHLLSNDIRHFVIDLRAVDFLDSTGLGSLVGSLKRVNEKDGSFKVVAEAERTLQIFRLTGLVRAFTIHASVPKAISGNEHWETALASEGLGVEEWCRKQALL